MSRIPIVFQVAGKGQIRFELVRHLSPITISHIIKIIPFSRRVHFLERNMGYVETGLNIGAEKQKSIFKRGDLGFMVYNGSICIVLQDIRGTNMNLLGHSMEDPLLLESIDSGEIIFIKHINGSRNKY